MKKIMTMLMIMAAMMFVATGAMAFDAGIGTKGISIDGSSGISMGTYDGSVNTVTIGVRGTNGYLSDANTNVCGVTTGTNANGSVTVAGAYIGNVGNVEGAGNFNAHVGGNYSADIDGVQIDGAYHSRSTITIGGSI